MQEVVEVEIDSCSAVCLSAVYNEEAERATPITDEDVARGSLEKGWFMITGTWKMHNGVTTPHRIECLQRSWCVQRAEDGTWMCVVDRELCSFQALKIRLADEDLELVTVPVGAVQPGMVVVNSVGEYWDSVYVWLGEHCLRPIRTNKIKWHTQTHILLLCTRPSMQFILK